jgi:hypothetical protein
MRTETNGPAAERAVVLQLLRYDRRDQCSPAQLDTALRHIRPLAILHAVGELERHGVARVTGEQVHASPCARHLNELDLIAV